MGLRIVELVDKRIDTSAQSWTRRSERRHPPEVDYSSELRNWVQQRHIGSRKERGLQQERPTLEPSRIFEIDQEWLLKQEQQGK
jgi:hypothetical protein